ncbi:MAG: lipoyl synthase [Candidatus Altiarchaeota archaeon]|nr:lipoyl synthase [Candidatus Altiarchaeota archaeon]
MERKPEWLKTKLTIDKDFTKVTQTLKRYNIYTVCEGARCPNKSECWGSGTATFMILGHVCTRNCSFCAVKTAEKGEAIDENEPANLGKAVAELNLKYVVLTSVDRDDLPDNGAKHYAKCIHAIKQTGAGVEALIPDYLEEELKTVLDAKPDVLAHNIEVVERLQNLRDRKASYRRSLQVLEEAKKISPQLKTKSSIMLGLGETEEEIITAMNDLREVDCDSLVLGQYLQPTKKQVPAKGYITPEKFEEYAEKATLLGFSKVISEPLARTSYKPC